MRRRTRRRGSGTVLGEGRERESEDSKEEKKCTFKSQINYRLKSMTMSYMHIYLI